MPISDYKQTTIIHDNIYTLTQTHTNIEIFIVSKSKPNPNPNPHPNDDEEEVTNGKRAKPNQVRTNWMNPFQQQILCVCVSNLCWDPLKIMEEIELDEAKFVLSAAETQL